MVVECAHLREAHRFTLAQPFDYDQLEELKRIADEKGVTILLFPQKSTPKARKLAGVEADAKTDEVDTKNRAVSSEGSKCILFTERIFSKEIRFF